jgi:hypothetical protein
MKTQHIPALSIRSSITWRIVFIIALIVVASVVLLANLNQPDTVPICEISYEAVTIVHQCDTQPTLHYFTSAVTGENTITVNGIAYDATRVITIDLTGNTNE